MPKAHSENIAVSAIMSAPYSTMPARNAQRCPARAANPSPTKSHHPRAHHAIPSEGTGFQEPTAIEAEQVKSTDVDKNVEPHGNNPLVNCRQTRRPKEIIRIAPAVSK